MDSYFLSELRERTRTLVQKSQNPKKTLEYPRKDFVNRLDSWLSKNLTSPFQDAATPKVAVLEMKGKGKAVVPVAEFSKGQRRDVGVQQIKQLRGGRALIWRPRGIVPPAPPPSKASIREADSHAVSVPSSVACGVTGKREILGKSHNLEADGCWSSDELAPNLVSHWIPRLTNRQFDPGGPSTNVSDDRSKSLVSHTK